MANRIDRHHHRELDKLTRQDAAAVLNFISGNKNSSRSLSSQTEIDDLIASLASAIENKRARQVTEWEQIGQRSIVRKV